MTQGVINRLAGNSFQLKGWSMPLIVAATVLIAKPDLPSPYFILLLAIPIFWFWGLGGYFLTQERGFREIYKKYSQQDETDFKMDPTKRENKSKCKWMMVVFSITISPFYLIEIILVGAVFVCKMNV